MILETLNYESSICKQLPRHICHLLESVGSTGDSMGRPVFVAGGFVRDLLVGRPNLDIDIVVEGDGIAFARAFAEDRNVSVKSHQRFGTAVIALPDGSKVDVATARMEVYDRPGALPLVEHSSIREDLHRRDFTINAMAVGLNEGSFGDLVDFFGGRPDIQNKLIRTLHDHSFVDDPTRIFRAIRFEQRYGFSIESHTQELMEQAVAEDRLNNITKQRLRNEILLILEEDNPVPVIRRMEHFGLMKYIHPRVWISDEEVRLFDRTKEILAWWNSTPGHNKVDPILLSLMALLDQLSTTEVEDVSRRLVLRKKYAEALRICRICLPDILGRMGEADKSPSAIYGALRGLPTEVLLFAMARADEMPCAASLRNSISQYLLRLRKAKPLVNGDDLHRLGYPQGPQYARILDRAFAAQLDGSIGDRRQAIQFIKDKFPL